MTHKEQTTNAKLSPPSLKEQQVSVTAPRRKAKLHSIIGQPAIDATRKKYFDDGHEHSTREPTFLRWAHFRQSPPHHRLPVGGCLLIVSNLLAILSLMNFLACEQKWLQQNTHKLDSKPTFISNTEHTTPRPSRDHSVQPFISSDCQIYWLKQNNDAASRQCHIQIPFEIQVHQSIAV